MEQNKEDESLLLAMLNDDCLAHIFRLISSLQMQVELSRVCQRFRDICMSRVWIGNNGYRSLCTRTVMRLLPNKKDRVTFLHLNREKFVEIEPHVNLNCFLGSLIDLNVVGFTGIHDFSSEEETICDLKMHDLTIFFPNVKTVDISGNISGRYLSHWRCLQELRLYGESETKTDIKNKYLDEICINCKQLRVLDIRNVNTSSLCLPYIEDCHLLETLMVNLSTLAPALHAVLNLPRLRRLWVVFDPMMYRYTNEFFEILNHKREKIVAIAVDNLYTQFTLGWDIAFGKIRQLEKLAFNDWELEADMLTECAKFWSLKALSCRRWAQLTNDILLRVLECSPQLKHLDVSYCRRVNKKFLPEAMRIVERQLPKHTLDIYCRHSGIKGDATELESEEWISQDFIKLHFDMSAAEAGEIFKYVEQGYQFEFAP